MRYYNTSESGIYLTVQDGRYHMDLPHPYIKEDIKVNIIDQPLRPGSFLLSIFNTDFSCVESVIEMFSDTINDKEFMEMETTSLEDSLDNCRDSIVSFMIQDTTYDYCVKDESSLHIFSELIATQLFDIIVKEQEKDYPSCFDDIVLDIKKMRLFSHMILDRNTLSEDCLSFIQRQMLRVQYGYSDGRLVQDYHVRSISELFALDAYMYMDSPFKMSFCKFCNHYFIKDGRNTEIYCRYPNPRFDGMSCFGYHEKNPKYTDDISKIVNRAIKTQNKYYNIHSWEDDEKPYDNDIWHKWTSALSKKEKEARITGDTSSLERFIKSTRFSRTGFSDIDYSDWD